MSTSDRDTIYRGYGFQLEFELQKADKSPELAVGTLATWKIGVSQTAPAALIIKADLSPSTIGGKTIIAIELTKEETDALPAGQYFHQLAVTLAGGQPRPYLGQFIMVEDRL